MWSLIIIKSYGSFFSWVFGYNDFLNGIVEDCWDFLFAGFVDFLLDFDCVFVEIGFKDKGFVFFITEVTEMKVFEFLFNLFSHILLTFSLSYRICIEV